MHLCRDAIWRGQTKISLGKAEGCGSVTSERNGGILCCYDGDGDPAAAAGGDTKTETPPATTDPTATPPTEAAPTGAAVPPTGSATAPTGPVDSTRTPPTAPPDSTAVPTGGPTESTPPVTSTKKPGSK